MKIPRFDEQWKCYPASFRSLLWYGVYVVLVCNRIYPLLALVAVFAASYLWTAACTVVRNTFRRKP